MNNAEITKEILVTMINCNAFSLDNTKPELSVQQITDAYQKIYATVKACSRGLSKNQ